MNTSLKRHQTPSTKSNKGMHYGIIVGLLAALLGVLYGYDSGTFSAVLPFWKQDFHITPVMEGMLGSSTIVGITIGVIFGGRITDAIGRQKMMVVVVTGFAITALLGAIPISAWWLIGIRLFLGFFIGFSQVAAPLFIGEFAPEKIRGALLVGYQVAQSVGHIIATYTAFFFVSSGTWEIVVGIAAVPGIILLLFIARFPDTPRWYLLKGYRDKAYETMKKIEPSEKVKDKIGEIDNELKEEKSIGKGDITRTVSKAIQQKTYFCSRVWFFCSYNRNDRC